ncbi:MAG: hypothetical protein FRX49_03798 [Trebouxia sp. A1-2]|nr:MAG: hypothetical protein FRX49_03798 [Trebouxia sp. A1-2]
MSSLDQWKPWVWAVFAFNCLFATVFALLCWETYRQFRNVTKSAAFAPALVDVKEWCVLQFAAWRGTALFDGAAVSAFFAVILVIIFTVCAIYYMIFTRKGLSHPGSRYGKGFMVALSFMTALHICNIATHFLSFSPAIKYWVTTFNVDFSRLLLTATYSFGYISTVFFLVFAFMLVIWKRTDIEILYAESPSTMSPQGTHTPHDGHDP